MHYEALADYYDVLINDEDGQARYADFVMQRLNDSGISSPVILELACGSGMLARMLAKNGYSVDASDVSASMISVAKQTWQEEINHEEKELGTLTFFELDMSQFTLTKQYDVVLCFCDSLNYLRNEEDIASMFVSVYQHLKPSGLFLFDSHSWDRLSEFSSGYEEANIIGDLEYQWNIDTVGEEIHQRLQVWDDSFVPVQYFEEEHFQRVYRSDFIVETLQNAGFESISIVTDFDLPGVVEGEKQFYICRR